MDISCIMSYNRVMRGGVLRLCFPRQDCSPAGSVRVFQGMSSSLQAHIVALTVRSSVLSDGVFLYLVSGEGPEPESQLCC